MCLVRQFIQGRQADIVADALVHDHGLVVTILGRVSNAVLDCCRNIVDLCSVRQRHRALSVVGCAENRFSDLVHSGFGQSAETKHLTFVKIKADIADDARHRHVFHGKHNLIRDFLSVIGTIVITGHLTSNHQTLEIILGHIRTLYGINVDAVAQDRDGIGFLQNLRQVM